MSAFATRVSSIPMFCVHFMNRVQRLSFSLVPFDGNRLASRQTIEHSEDKIESSQVVTLTS